MADENTTEIFREWTKMVLLDEKKLVEDKDPKMANDASDENQSGVVEAWDNKNDRKIWVLNKRLAGGGYGEGLLRLVFYTLHLWFFIKIPQLQFWI